MTTLATDWRRRAALGADLAFDRETVRDYDADGRLNVSKANISKANICEYFGREIPGFQELGLDPDRKYRLLRHPEEIAKAAPTFNRLPILSKHEPVDVDNHPAELVIGTTGSDASFEAPYLTNSLSFWTRDALDGIESEKQKELSAGYRYRADMTPGTHEGEPYDGVMRDIVGNHLALVKEGRAGPDVVVGDSAPPPSKELTEMSTKLSRKAAITKGALIAYLGPKLAQDQKFDPTPLVADVTAKNFKEKKPAIIAGLKTGTKDKLAKDATVDDVTTLLDALEGVDPTDEGADEGTTDPNAAPPNDGKKPGEGGGLDDDAEKVLAQLKGKVSDELIEQLRKLVSKPAADKAKDADPEKDKDTVTKAAMDQAIATAVKAATDQATATQKAIRDAERDVRPWVGDLAMAHDSAEAVYRTALTALGVDVKDVHPSALSAILKAQPKPGVRQQEQVRVGMDAATTSDYSKMFPGAARIQVQS